MVNCWKHAWLSTERTKQKKYNYLKVGEIWKTVILPQPHSVDLFDSVTKAIDTILFNSSRQRKGFEYFKPKQLFLP